MTTHTIDATNQSLGRLASQIAVILRGKTNPAYQPNIMPQEKVIVNNVKLIKFTGNKLKDKKYFHYSGYPGGMTERTLGTLFTQDPKRVLFKAVNNMLHKNRLRSEILKNLEIN